MSDLVTRFRTMFQARASSAVERMDDPRASLDYSLVKLEENRHRINYSLVEVSTARRRVEEQRNLVAANIQRYWEQAEVAMRGEHEAIARTALERRQEAQIRLTELGKTVETLAEQVTQLKEGQLSLDRKIALFRAKKEELKSVYDASQAQLQVREALSGISQDLTDVGHTIRRIEERIAAIRARTEAIRDLVSEGLLTDALETGGDDIDQQLSRMGRAQAVEEEFARLKAEVSGSD